MTDDDLKRFNEIFHRFKASAASKYDSEPFITEVISLPMDSSVPKVKLITTLGFEARRTVKVNNEMTVDEQLEKRKLENEKDHLATILDMCGLMPGGK